jgi:hypothetical protein
MAKERTGLGDVLGMLGGGSRRAAPAKAATALAVVAAGAPEQEKKTEAPFAATPAEQESLVERVLKSRGHVVPEEARDELASLHAALQDVSRKTVVLVFALGKVLAEVKAELPHGDFLPWVEGNCSFSRFSASNYMRVYEHYKLEPRKALQELSLTEAYIEAGVKKLALPEPEDIHRRGEIDASDGLPTMEDFKSIFSKKPMSGVDLKHYRVVPFRDGELYAVRPETGPVKVCDLFVDMSIEDPQYQDALQEVHHNVAMALEVFYSKVEACEERGILNAPFDSSRKAMAGKMRNVSPKDGEKKKAPRAKKRGK